MTEQVKALTVKLEAGLQELFNSDKYAAYLKSMSSFYNYSLNNTILIAVQRPDATRVAGFAKWKSMGRCVKKGEKGIKILAPSPYKLQDDDGNEVLIPSFRPVSVFDVSQTEGEELPEILNILTGTVDGYASVMKALTTLSPVPVSFERITTGANGYYSQTEKRIVVNDGMSQAQTIKTTVHEISHALLHDKDTSEQQFDKYTKEVQAESIAYVVCQHFGLDTSEYSFGYIAGWSSGRETSELKASLDLIRTTADNLITDMEAAMASPMKEAVA